MSEMLTGPQLRLWCVEKSIGWCQPNDGCSTQQMLDAALMMERFVVTGKASPVVEVSELKRVLSDAAAGTHAVSQIKASAVVARIKDSLGLKGE